MSARPLVSVIVPVRDGADYLPSLMEALDRQTLPYDQFEVVIADDGSLVPPIAWETDDGHVRVLSDKPINAYAARNRGVRASNGEILAFCDADCVPEPDWLEQGIVALASHDVVAGRVRFMLPAKRTIWTVIDMDTSKNQAFLVTRGLGETANLLVRRDRFDAVGGFDERVEAHSDYDFVERSCELGASLGYAEDAVVGHPTRQAGPSVLRAQWVYARAYAEQRTIQGKPVTGLKLRTWLPVLGVARFRARHGFALSAATTWLAENDVYPTFNERLLSLPLIYLLLPYLGNIAQLVGASRGARRRRVTRA
jgi:glycosyltransferase involved in cell wall biosynthesis